MLWKDKKVIEVGHKYGKWTIIENYQKDYISPSGRKRHKWIVQCECGFTKVLTDGALTGPRGSKQCRKCATRQRSFCEDYEGIKSTFWYTVVKGATNRGHELKVDQKYVWELFSNKIKNAHLPELN